MERISLKAARADKGFTQTDIANELHVTKKTVSSWENGKTMPKLHQIEPLCNLLGRKYDEIRWHV